MAEENARPDRSSIAYIIIEAMRGHAAAERAKNFVTGHWCDAMRAAEAVSDAFAAASPALATRTENAEVGELRAGTSAWAMAQDAVNLVLEEGPQLALATRDDEPFSHERYQEQVQARMARADALINAVLAALQPPPSTAAGREVTQIDRQWAAFAGASIWNPLWANDLAESVLRGARDDTDLVQAFVQHRLALAPAPGEGS